MSQSGYTPIILFNSTTSGNTPTTGNLAVGELAINVADGKLFFNQSGTIKVLANASSATIPILPQYGGTGVANNSANTLTFTGNYSLGLTLTANTSVTLPTSGTLVNTAVTTLSSLSSIGTITTGTWNGSIITGTYGGTGVNNGSNTITIAGNVTHAGAYTQTFTATGNTSVTLPTSGYLISSVTQLGANPVTGTPSSSTYLRGDGTWATVTAGVSQIVAGTNITISPSGGTGAVTINASGGAPGGSNTNIQFNNSGSFGGSSSLTWDGSSITAPQAIASNGLFVNNQTIGTSYSVANGYGASSVGPVTLSSGVSVTLGASSRWVIL